MLTALADIFSPRPNSQAPRRRWLLLRLPRPGPLFRSALCAQEDPVSFGQRQRQGSLEGGRSVSVRAGAPFVSSAHEADQAGMSVCTAVFDIPTSSAASTAASSRTRKATARSSSSFTSSPFTLALLTPSLACSLFLPYYSRGNLQDAINSHALNGTQFNERDMLNLFLGTCYAVRAMHHYRPGATTTYPPTNDASTVEFDVGLEEGGSESTATLVPNGKRPGTGGRGKHRPLAQHDHSDDEEDSDEEAEHHGLRDAKGQERPLMGTIGSLANAVASEEGSSVPGLAGSSSAPITAVLDPQPPPSASGSGAGGEGKGKAQPWAHRDLKPANVMIADDGTPILMDFGSAIPGRVEIPNRSVALAQQDLAAECVPPILTPLRRLTSEKLTSRTMSQTLFDAVPGA